MKKDDALKMDSLDQISWVKNEFEYGDGNKSDKIYFTSSMTQPGHFITKGCPNSPGFIDQTAGWL